MKKEQNIPEIIKKFITKYDLLKEYACHHNHNYWPDGYITLIENYNTDLYIEMLKYCEEDFDEVYIDIDLLRNDEIFKYLAKNLAIIYRGEIIDHNDKCSNKCKIYVSGDNFNDMDILFNKLIMLEVGATILYKFGKSSKLYWEDKYTLYV